MLLPRIAYLNLDTSCSDSFSFCFPHLLYPRQAIDKLEDLLNGDMKSGSMFGPREYVEIYT